MNDCDSFISNKSWVCTVGKQNRLYTTNHGLDSMTTFFVVCKCQELLFSLFRCFECVKFCVGFRIISTWFAKIHFQINFEIKNKLTTNKNLWKIFSRQLIWNLHSVTLKFHFGSSYSTVQFDSVVLQLHKIARLDQQKKNLWSSRNAYSKDLFVYSKDMG